MSDYDQFVPATKTATAPSGGNEYLQYVPGGQSEPGFGSGGFGAVEKAAGKVGAGAAKTVGRAIVAGHKDPIGSFLNVMQGPQRLLQAGELDTLGGEHITPQEAWNPKSGPMLKRKTEKALGLDPQGFVTQNILGGNDQSLPKKLLRGAAHTTLDVVNDPLTLAPVGKVAGVLRDVIPGVKPATEAIGKAVANSPVGALLNPDHYIRGLTPEAKAEYEVATNKGMEAVRAHKVADDAVIKAHAKELRAGVMPDEVAKLFRSEEGKQNADAWKQYLTDDKGKLKFGPGTRPQEVSAALFKSRAPEFKAAVMPELQKAGFFTSPSGLDASRGMGKTDKFTVPIDEIPEVQTRLARNVESKMNPPNEIIKGAQKLTRLGNKAFLANPIPHTFNLADLAYNRYGAPTVGKGLVNAARVATGKTGGKLGENINELESLGAKSQYGNIFDEMGLTRIAGIPRTEGAASLANKALIPLQRASNAAQHKILNSTETGLRASALDAERASGAEGAQAAKNIHAAFGTDAPNAITDSASGLGMPFAKFHLQTAPGSVLGTLAKNPARITNTLKAEQDMNQQVNPHGPKYRSTVPGANAARMIMDPLGYFGSLGPISELNSPYGLKAELQKGPKGVAKVAGDSIAKFTPGSQEAAALMEILKKKKGRAKETGQQDLITSLLGGYYAK